MFREEEQDVYRKWILIEFQNKQYQTIDFSQILNIYKSQQKYIKINLNGYFNSEVILSFEESQQFLDVFKKHW